MSLHSGGRLARALLPSLALLAGGCSTVYEDRYARDEGWRRGTVVEVVRSDAIRDAGPGDCRGHRVSTDAGALATVAFFGRDRRSTITVPLPAQSAVHAGDRVYVNIGDCDVSLVSRGRE